MPSIATVLKQEITRLAKKEIRTATASLKSQLTQSRKQVAALQKAVQRLEKQVEKLAHGKRSLPPLPETDAENAPVPIRFTPKSVRAHRKRLGMSAEQYAKILGVSMQTVYHWEQGKSRPRRTQMNVLTTVRAMGKREALRRLELIEARESKSPETKSTTSTASKSNRVTRKDPANSKAKVNGKAPASKSAVRAVAKKSKSKSS